MCDNGDSMKKVKTGIKGLDEMLEGGIPEKHHVLVCGGPGTGKTILCMEYLYRGAEMGEKGLFITLEENPDRIIENMKHAFPKWTKFEKFINERKIIIEKPNRYDFKNFSDIFQSYVTVHKVKRAVIDSATILKLSFESPMEFRKRLFDFLSFVTNLDCTVLLTSELSIPFRDKMRFSLEQFVVDGVIILYSVQRKEKRIRALEILKMRGTNHAKDLVPFKITSNGIVVYKGEKVY